MVKDINQLKNLILWAKEQKVLDRKNRLIKAEFNSISMTNQKYHRIFSLQKVELDTSYGFFEFSPDNLSCYIAYQTNTYFT